jgi:hypothetical protein
VVVRIWSGHSDNYRRRTRGARIGGIAWSLHGLYRRSSGTGESCDLDRLHIVSWVECRIIMSVHTYDRMAIHTLPFQVMQGCSNLQPFFSTTTQHYPLSVFPNQAACKAPPSTIIVGRCYRKQAYESAPHINSLVFALLNNVHTGKKSASCILHI